MVIIRTNVKESRIQSTEGVAPDGLHHNSGTDSGVGKGRGTTG